MISRGCVWTYAHSCHGLRYRTTRKFLETSAHVLTMQPVELNQPMALRSKPWNSGKRNTNIELSGRTLILSSCGPGSGSSACSTRTSRGPYCLTIFMLYRRAQAAPLWNGMHQNVGILQPKWFGSGRMTMLQSLLYTTRRRMERRDCVIVASSVV